MIIKTKHHKGPFVILDTRPLENPALSWRAKGLWSYLISRPDDWTVIGAHLVTVSRDGKESLQSALRELSKEGYAELVTTRADDGSGRVTGKHWLVYEDPTDRFTERRESRPTVDPLLPKMEEETKTEKKSKKEEPSHLIVMPDFPGDPEVQQLWEDFVANRKELKNPLTSRGRAMALKRLRGWRREVQVAALEHAIEKNYDKLWEREPDKQKPKMSYRTREERINDLNRKKQELIRANAPYFKIHEIDMQLSKL